MCIIQQYTYVQTMLQGPALTLQLIFILKCLITFMGDDAPNLKLACFCAISCYSKLSKELKNDIETLVDQAVSQQ